MSYYDDYDDEYSSEDDIFYQNYSVDYANQILGGHHGISSCLPRVRRIHRRLCQPRLVRVATLDQMPTINRHHILPSLYSRPKYGNNVDISFQPSLPSRLPSLEATSEELERRATQTIQPTFQETSHNISSVTGNNNPSSENTYRPMTEAELRQVQQQQEAFQQHLLNMQRQLLEQTQEQQVPTPSSSTTSRRFEKRTKIPYHDLERDDDQTEIAELIENDPYFAAAMEDFADTHGLLNNHRQRTHSKHSSSGHSHHLCKRHRTQYFRDNSHQSPSPSRSSLTQVTPDFNDSNIDLVMLRELHGIRRLMEEFVHVQNNTLNPNQPTMPIMPIPWSMNGNQFPMITPTGGIHYPPVAPVTDYKISMVPSERAPPPNPNRAIYQNVVNVVKDVIDRRSPSQREQPLKPSQIDLELKGKYTKRPKIPLPSNQQQQQQRRRRSSQMATPPIVQPPSPPLPLSSNNIPPTPYEALANFSASQSIINKNRNLSYGNRGKQLNIYDSLFPGRYLHLYTNKYN